MQPLLKFIITPHTFTIETNEDGFSRKNVEAICETGQSPKKHDVTDEHTGEKGFGFKSVFSVAENVHIQSGLWSFHFEHHQGEDGLGMVTPLDAEPEELPKDMTTRITLHLTSSAAKDYKRLLEAIADMPDTTLLFLRKLSSLRIEITHLHARKETIMIRKAVINSGALVEISRSRTYGGSTETTASLYHRFTNVVLGMPEHERRKGRNKTSIDLAFPINPETEQPQTSTMGQHIFAYLPLQRLPQLQVRRDHEKIRQGLTYLA